MPAEESEPLLAVPRLILWLPRAASAVVFYPLVAGIGVLEEHHVYDRVYWALTSDDELVGLRPSARYRQDYGLSLGLRYFDERSLGPESLFEVEAEVGGFDKTRVGVRMDAPERLIGLAALHDRNPDAIFTGIHGEHPDDLARAGRARTRYGYDRRFVRLHSELPLAPPLLLRLRADVDVRSYTFGDGRGDDRPISQVYCAAPLPSGGCAGLDERLVPGFAEGLSLVRGGTDLELFARDADRHGTGLVTKGGVSYAYGMGGDRSRHVTLEGDTRVFLGFSDSQLVVRLRVGAVEPLGRAPIPFEELRDAGGPELLRGVSPGELRGATEVAGSIEHRWLVAPFVDGFVFVDHGGAFDRGFEGLSWDELVPSVGGGFRLVEPTEPYWRAPTLGGVQLAWAPDYGFRFMFSVGI